MTPLLESLTVQDFRSIRGRVQVSLDAPVVLIQGANGTGKTSLFSALELALTRGVASLERFDPDYIAHLPHKHAADGWGHVALAATGFDGAGEVALTVTGTAIEGRPGLLSPGEARFFVERCYLTQATLGRLLEIYEHQDTRRTDSPLTRFVKELLGLEPLDALIEGLHSVGNVRRLRATAPLYWAARADMPRLGANVTAAREAQNGLRSELAAREASFRELAGSILPAGEAIEPATLRRRLRALADASESKLRELARRRRDLAGAVAQVEEAAAADAEGARAAAEAASSCCPRSTRGVGTEFRRADREAHPDNPGCVSGRASERRRRGRCARLGHQGGEARTGATDEARRHRCGRWSGVR